jgi:hypothetical protein
VPLRAVFWQAHARNAEEATRAAVERADGLELQLQRHITETERANAMRATRDVRRQERAQAAARQEDDRLRDAMRPLQEENRRQADVIRRLQTEVSHQRAHPWRLA